MFARKLLAFSLACLLAASPAFAFEELEPLPESGQPIVTTESFEATGSGVDLPADKFVGEDTIATGSDTEQPVDADS